MLALFCFDEISIVILMLSCYSSRALNFLSNFLSCFHYRWVHQGRTLIQYTAWLSHRHHHHPWYVDRYQFMRSLLHRHRTFRKFHAYLTWTLNEKATRLKFYMIYHFTRDNGIPKCVPLWDYLSAAPASAAGVTSCLRWIVWQSNSVT